MAYKKQYLIDTALNAIKANDLIYLDEVFAFVPYSKSIFYSKKLDELDDIKNAINTNKVKTKAALRKNWRYSDNPTLQIALYKLIGTDEETDRLNGSRQKVEHTGQIGTNHCIRLEFAPSPVPIDTDDYLSIEDQEKLKQLHAHQ
jgi:hypothetical protein